MSKIIGTNGIEITKAADFQLVNYRGSKDEFTFPSKLLTLQFVAVTKCTVVINSGTDIGLEAGDTFAVPREDLDITSFVIKEKSTQYKFVATI